MRKTDTGIPNWELCAWIIVGKLLVGKNRNFNRSEFMKNDNLSMAEWFTKLLGHKKDPQRVENTLQRTLQNMRDKGYIDFLGNGEYRLTENGNKKLNEIKYKDYYDKLMSAYKEIRDSSK